MRITLLSNTKWNKINGGEDAAEVITSDVSEKGRRKSRCSGRRNALFGCGDLCSSSLSNPTRAMCVEREVKMKGAAGAQGSTRG